MPCLIGLDRFRGFGGQARIWDLSGRLQGELAGHESSVNAICISDDGTTVVTASSDRTVRTWDLSSRRERAVLGRHRKQVTALALDSRRGRVWSGSHDGRLQAWDPGSGELLETVAAGAVVTSVAVRPGDGSLAVATLGAGLAIRSPEGDEVTRLAEEHEVVTAVAWSADGAFLLASHPGGATAWATDGWEPVRALGGGGGLLPIALGPDGSLVALGWDNHVGLWGPDRDEPEAVVDGLPKGVYGLSFSHDGRLLAMAAADGRVRTWTVS